VSTNRDYAAAVLANFKRARTPAPRTRAELCAELEAALFVMGKQKRKQGRRPFQKQRMRYYDA
jgi:hypothetical protein